MGMSEDYVFQSVPASRGRQLRHGGIPLLPTVPEPVLQTDATQNLQPRGGKPKAGQALHWKVCSEAGYLDEITQP